MKIFIPSNEINEELMSQGFSFQPLIINAYCYHLSESSEAELEKTQNLFSKKVNMGTTMTNIGNTRVE